MLAQEKVNHTAEEETYHTQEGCRLALREATVKNVPPELITKLEDSESELGNVEPSALLALITLNAYPATVLDAKELKELCDAPLVFDGYNNLMTQFSAFKKCIQDLARIHHVTTSESEMMMEWLLQIERQKDFKDEVKECRSRTANNTYR